MPFVFSRRGASAAGYPLITDNNTILVGKYRVSPLSKRLDDGLYAASVSIRGGRGSATTDRVLRFKGSFGSEAAAHQYAHEQGLIWIAQSQPQGTSPWPRKN